MPETIRTANERLCSRPGRGGFLAAFVFAILCILSGTPVHAGAAEASALFDAAAGMSRQEIASLTLTLGLVCFAVLVTIVLLRTRKAAERLETASRDETNALR